MVKRKVHPSQLDIVTAQTAVQTFTQELLQHTDAVGEPLRSASVVSPITALNQLRSKSRVLNDLLLPNGATLSLHDVDHENLHLHVSRKALAGIGVQAVHYALGKAQANILELNINFADGASKATQIISAYTATDQPSTMPVLSRRVEVPLYAENGYEGHLRKTADPEKVQSEDVLAFVSICRYILENRQ